MSEDKPGSEIWVDQLNEIHKYSPAVSKIHVNKEHIYRFLGMQPSDSDAYLSDLIDEYLEIGIKICQPKTSYAIFDNPQFDMKNKIMTLDGIAFNVGKMVASFMRKSIYVAVFVGTCGEDIGKLSKQLMSEGHTLEGYIVDIIGSELAEEIIELLHRHIERKVHKQAHRVTNRYSPGYCNWPVSDQHNLFSLLKGETCNVTLTPSSLMMPVKSVSGVLGIGPDVKKVAYKCQHCPDENCILRGKG